MFYEIAVPALVGKKTVIVTAIGLGLVALAVDPTVFAAAVVTVIMAITGAAVTIINAVSKAKLELLAQTQAVAETAIGIKAHVDGMTTRAAADRTADKDTIVALHQQLADSERRAALVAQSKAIVAVVSPIAATVEVVTRPKDSGEVA